MSISSTFPSLSMSHVVLLHCLYCPSPAHLFWLSSLHSPLHSLLIVVDLLSISSAFHLKPISLNYLLICACPLLQLSFSLPLRLLTISTFPFPFLFLSHPFLSPPLSTVFATATLSLLSSRSSLPSLCSLIPLDLWRSSLFLSPLSPLSYPLSPQLSHTN